MKDAKASIDSKELTVLLVEIKLSVNNSLYEKGAISEDMYARAKELIINDG